MRCSSLGLVLSTDEEMKFVDNTDVDFSCGLPGSETPFGDEAKTVKIKRQRRTVGLGTFLGVVAKCVTMVIRGNGFLKCNFYKVLAGISKLCNYGNKVKGFLEM